MKTFVLITFMSLFIGNAYSIVCDTNPIRYNILSSIELIIKSTSPKDNNSHDGSISISIEGGTAPYTTHIAGTNFPAETFYKTNFKLSNLGVGSFTVIVQDQSKQVVYKSIDIKVQ